MDWVKTKLRPTFANEQKTNNDLRGQQMATNVKSIKKTIQYYWDALSSFQFFQNIPIHFYCFFFAFSLNGVPFLYIQITVLLNSMHNTTQHANDVSFIPRLDLTRLGSTDKTRIRTLKCNFYTFLIHHNVQLFLASIIIALFSTSINTLVCAFVYLSLECRCRTSQRRHRSTTTPSSQCKIKYIYKLKQENEKRHQSTKYHQSMCIPIVAVLRRISFDISILHLFLVR